MKVQQTGASFLRVVKAHGEWSDVSTRELIFPRQ
jgi:hypothetical protein